MADQLTLSYLESGPVYFVSGHLDLTYNEFVRHYVPRLERAIETPKARFVVGDSIGADQIAQSWLAGCEASVTVFHVLSRPKINTGPFPTQGGFLSDLECDEAMTHASTRDIAWVRPGREASGTAANIARRMRTAAEHVEPY